MTKKTWKEFKDSKLLWWVNRSLHLFGWAIVVVEEADGTIVECFPARVDFRGFSGEDEEAGFEELTKHLAENTQDLMNVFIAPNDRDKIDDPQTELQKLKTSLETSERSRRQLSTELLTLACGEHQLPDASGNAKLVYEQIQKLKRQEQGLEE